MSIYFEWAASHGAWEVGKHVLRLPFSSVGRALARRSPLKPVTLCLRHRDVTRQKYYEAAFTCGERDILYVSIMSQATLNEIEGLLEKSRQTGTTLRVLTWHREMAPQTIEAFRRHIQEHNDDPPHAVRRVQEATERWEYLARRYSDEITVREYRSAPTMQGIIVPKRWALIELIPFGTVPRERPALLLEARKDPAVFELFSESFEKLWRDCGETLKTTVRSPK